MTSPSPEHAIGHSPTLLDMATREVAHLPANHRLDEAARIMAKRRISSIVVVDEANHPVGIVTERDIVKAMHDDYAKGKTLQAVMSSPVITVPASMPSEEAYHTCLARGIRHLVLVNDTEVLTGVVSETDFRLHMSLATLTGRRRVSSIMTRAVLSLPPTASLKAALAHMQAHGDNCVVVVDEERPIGIVTERDIVRLYADARAQDTLPLRDIMAHPVLRISQEGTTQEAATRMLEARVRHLVVVNAQEQLVGLISEHDLTQAMAIGLIDARLDAERHFLHTLVDTIPDLVWLKSPEGVYLACNPRFERFFGASEADIVGKTDYDFVDPALADFFRANDLKALAANSSNVNQEWVTFADDGHRELLETIKTPMRDASGQVIGVLGIARDITERIKTESKLRLAASVFANSREGILITNAAGAIIDVNPAFTEITGYSREEVLGQNPRLLRSDRHPKTFYAEMWQTLVTQGTWRGEIWNKRKSGELFVELLSISAVHDETSSQLSYVGVFTDISQLKAHEAELDRIAHYDALTGVPNRLLLNDRLEQALARARRSGRPLAVCYLDLDGFKPINDQYGHNTGDHLLIEITRHLQNSLRADDTLARLGGDEFVLLLNNLSHEQECRLALDRILAAAAQPIELGDGISVSVSASIGVTLFPNDHNDADTLLRHADQAMYRAKEAGRNRYHLFDPEHDRQIKAHFETLQYMREALTRNHFVLYYQPKVDMVSGEVLGAEALLRWQHPTRGLLAPGEFLPLLDNTELEIELGEWVIANALQQMATWQATGTDFQISVNISAHHLQRADFPARLKHLLAGHPGFDPTGLQLEILESAAIDNFEQASHTLRECLALGVDFALDDFGTGYSSLSYFRKLAAHTLKIDQSFVRDMLEDPEDLAIVETVIRLAATFNRAVIAEGVESLEHGAMLVRLGCRQAQGYGIARPMPVERLSDWVAGWQGQATWRVVAENEYGIDAVMLLVAAASHRRWMRELTAFVHGRRRAPPPLDSTECRFGHWYHDIGASRYRGMPAFDALDLPHQHIHERAQKAVHLLRGGTPAEALAELVALQMLSKAFLDAMNHLAEQVRGR